MSTVWAPSTGTGYGSIAGLLQGIGAAAAPPCPAPGTFTGFPQAEGPRRSWTDMVSHWQRCPSPLPGMGTSPPHTPCPAALPVRSGSGAAPRPWQQPREVFPPVPHTPPWLDMVLVYPRELSLPHFWGCLSPSWPREQTSKAAPPMPRRTGSSEGSYLTPGHLLGESQALQPSAQLPPRHCASLCSAQRTHL